MPPALRFLLLVFAGWVNRKHQDTIDYLQEENRVLREQLGDPHPRLTDLALAESALKLKHFPFPLT